MQHTTLSTRPSISGVNDFASVYPLKTDTLHTAGDVANLWHRNFLLVLFSLCGFVLFCSWTMGTQLWQESRASCVVIISRRCWTPLRALLLDFDAHTTSLPCSLTFTGCVHLNVSSLSWRHWSTGHCTLASRYLSDDLRRVADIPSRRQLRSASSCQLEVPRTRLTSVGDRTFSAAGSRLWNSLPRDIADCQTVETFKRKLKHFLFSLSFSGL